MNSKRFDYAYGCFQVFPVSFEKRYNGIGTMIKEKEYRSDEKNLDFFLVLFCDFFFFEKNIA